MMIDRFQPSLQLSMAHKSLLKDTDVSSRLKIGLIRGILIGKLIEEAVEVFKDTEVYHQIMDGAFEGSLLGRVSSTPYS